jgi:hypothetical protein
VLDSRELRRGRGSSLIKLRAKIEQISARTDVRLRDRSLVRDAVVVLSGTTRATACAESGHRPPHGWLSLDLVQSFVQDYRQGIRDRLRLLPACRRAGDMLVVW